MHSPIVMFAFTISVVSSTPPPVGQIASGGTGIDAPSGKEISNRFGPEMRMLRAERTSFGAEIENRPAMSAVLSIPNAVGSL